MRASDISAIPNCTFLDLTVYSNTYRGAMRKDVSDRSSTGFTRLFNEQISKKNIF